MFLKDNYIIVLPLNKVKIHGVRLIYLISGLHKNNMNLKETDWDNSEILVFYLRLDILYL